MGIEVQVWSERRLMGWKNADLPEIGEGGLTFETLYGPAVRAGGALRIAAICGPVRGDRLQSIADRHRPGRVSAPQAVCQEAYRRANIRSTDSPSRIGEKGSPHVPRIHRRLICFETRALHEDRAWTRDAGHVFGTYIPERRALPLQAGRTSAGALRPELPPWTLAVGLPYALGLALLTDVISDLVEVLLRRRLVVWKPPSTDPTPLAHSHERTALRMRLGASRARETGHVPPTSCCARAEDAVFDAPYLLTLQVHEGVLSANRREIAEPGLHPVRGAFHLLTL